METIKNAVNTLLARTPKGPKVRYAVVAGGWISQAAFMPGIGQTNNSVMTVLVSGDAEKNTKLAEKYGLKSYTYEDYEKFLEADEADAIYIATPNSMHQKFAVPALERGYHVLLEKPMEVTVEACEAIIAAQKKSGAKLMIAYRLHCEPGTLNIIDRVRNGDFGDPRIFSSTFVQPVKEDNHRSKMGFDSGPMPDMGPYPLNAVRNLFGQEPISVRAQGFKTPGSKLSLEHDTITVMLRFPFDRSATFTVGYTQNSYEEYTVSGTKGSITASPCFMFGPGIKIAYRAKVGDKEESKTFSEVDHFAGETEYFSDCIINNVEVEADGEEGLLDVRVIVAVKQSLEQNGAEIKLEQRVRTKRPLLQQEKQISLAPQPKEVIGRDSENPCKGKKI